MVRQRSHSIILPSSPLLNDDPSFRSVDDPPSPIFRIPSPIIHPVVIPSIPCDPIPYKRRTESDATIRPSVKQLERENEDWEDVDMTPRAEKETFIFFDIEKEEKEEEGTSDKWLLCVVLFLLFITVWSSVFQKAQKEMSHIPNINYSLI